MTLKTWRQTNDKQTDLVLFTSPKKQPDSELKIKVNGKKLCETDSVKYLGIQLDKSQNW